MKQDKINKAYPALLRLSSMKFPIKKARDIYILSNKMQQHFEFALAEEQKCVDEFGGMVNSDGTVSFKTQEDFGKFQERMQELNESEIEWLYPAVVLTDKDTEGQMMTVQDIRDLEGFISFE